MLPRRIVQIILLACGIVFAYYFASNVEFTETEITSHVDLETKQRNADRITSSSHGEGFAHGDITGSWSNSNTSRQSGSKSPSTRICSPEERLAMLNKFCTAHSPYFKYKDEQVHGGQRYSDSKTISLAANNGTAGHMLDVLSDDDVLALSHELWLDRENQLIVCMHAKAGCSTWKTILANNTGPDPLPEAYNGSIHTYIYERGLTCADDGRNVREIRERLKTWYKVIIVRHPFDRLVSAYTDKFGGDNMLYEITHGSSILRKYRPYLPEKMLQQGKGVLFQEFIKFLLSLPMDWHDDHFAGPYERKCLACLLGYHYVVKLETNDHDALYIVNEKLKGRGMDVKRVNRNVKREGGGLLTGKGRDLSHYFANLTAEEYDGIYRRHAADLAMYGYVMTNDTFVASCGQPEGCC